MPLVVDGVKLPDNVQEGGWYSGRQAWKDPNSGNWTLSAPGQINALSNQVGAGQMVSDEVNRQSSVAQGQAPDAISNYLKQQQKSYVPGGSQSVGTSGVPLPGGGGGEGIGFSQPQSSLNLPELYQNLYKDLGIADKEEQIKQSEKNYLEARNKIANNPYLSASSMDRRLARIRQQYETETAPIRNEIATKKADIEMQLNLQTKQFDINSEIARQAMDQFNSLLGMGALDRASGEDIAAITRATGLSSSMIQNAIQTQRLSNLQTSIQSFDDGNEEGFVIYSIDPAGNIVNQVRQVTGTSSRAATSTIDDWAKSYLMGGGAGVNTSTRSGGGYSISDASSLLQLEAENLYSSIVGN